MTITKTNSLKQFHDFVAISDPSISILWHIDQAHFISLVPPEHVVHRNQYWVTVNCELPGLSRPFSFNFVPFPDAVFHEIQFSDDNPDTIQSEHAAFAAAIQSTLGEPLNQFDTLHRWHDKKIVTDLCISDVSNTPLGIKYPVLFFKFRNSTRYAPHWNNRPQRTPGFDWRIEKKCLQIGSGVRNRCPTNCRDYLRLIIDNAGLGDVGGEFGRTRISRHLISPPKVSRECTETLGCGL